MPLNVQCKRCANLHNDWCKLVVDSPDPDMIRDCQYYRTLTNYDRFVSKSPEELAEYFHIVVDCEFCPMVMSARECTDGKYCKELWLDWLKQEVGDG